MSSTDYDEYMVYGLPRLTTRFDLVLESMSTTEGLRKTASALSSRSDLFLSHSRKDQGHVTRGAVQVLATAGASVYASFLDPEAEALNPGQFGSFFSQAIDDTKRLVVLHTKHTRKSRWIPWELGLAHGRYRFPRVAVWPVVDHIGGDNSWVEWEYLNIYPRVQRYKLDDGRFVFGVADPTDQSWWFLEQWLAQ